MNHTDAMLDDAAAYAVGALPEPEAAAIRAHIAECAVCADEYRAASVAAVAVGKSAEADDLDEVARARMKARLMSAIAARPSAPTHARAARVERTSFGAWSGFVAAALAAVVAASALAGIVRMHARERADDARIAALRADLGLLARCTSGRFPVPGGAIVRCEGRVIVALGDAPALPEGHVFQVWTLRRGAKGVEPNVTFLRQPDGSAIADVANPPPDLAAIAVNVEPAGGSEHPTTTPLFVRPLPNAS